MLLATAASYPWWFILVLVFGAGGFGTALIWAASRIWAGAKGISEVLTVLRGDQGGQGRRKITPLVDVVDGLVAVQELQGHDLALLRTDLSAVHDEIVCNGGNTNTIGDRTVRAERNLADLHTALEAHVAQDQEVQEALKVQVGKVQTTLEGMKT